MMTLEHSLADSRQCSRVAGIDHFRGIVCLSILLGHLFLDRLDPLVGTLRPGTECFLVLSGFFLAYMLSPSDQPTSVRRFARRRLRRLFVPYAVALSVSSVVPYLMADIGRLVGYPAIHLTWPTVGTFAADYLAALFCVSDLAGREVPGAYWSMVVLLQATVMMSALFWLLRWALLRTGLGADRQAFAGLTVIAGCGFLAGLPLVTARDHQTWWMSWSASYLAAGWLVAVTARRRTGWWVAAVVGMSLVAESVVAIWSAPTGGQPLPYRPLFAAAAVGLLTALTRRGNRPVTTRLNWLAAVGRRSYSLYLTHATTAFLVVTPARKFGWMDSPIGVVVWTAMSVLAAGVAGWAFYSLVERPMADRPVHTTAPETKRLARDTTRLMPLSQPHPALAAAAGNTSTPE